VAEETLFTEDRVPPADRVLGIRGIIHDEAIKRIRHNMRPALRSAKPALPDEEFKIIERTVENFLGLGRLNAPVYLAVSFGYADIPIGKAFSAVFAKSRASVGATTQCVLRAVINEWLPLAMDGIPHGHRSVCLFDFSQGVPDLIAQLPPLTFPAPGEVEERLFLCTQQTWELRKRVPKDA
jgi:hypothetical protein